MTVAAQPQTGEMVERGQGSRWWFVITGFVCMIVGVNTFSTLVNVLSPALRAEFGWSAVGVSQGLTYFLIADGISVFATGYLIDRVGLRRATIPLAAVFGLAIAGLSFLTGSLGVLYALSILAGLAVGPSTQVAHSIVITAWFGDRRGLALGILNVGLGICGTVMPFIIGALLSSAGWRTALLSVGLTCAVVPLLVFSLVTRMPPGYEAARREAKAAGRMMGVPFTTIVRTSRPFWFISIAIFFISTATAGVLGQVVPITTGQGAAMPTALAILSSVSISSIASRFVVGYLLDRVFAPIVSAVMFVICGAGVLILCLATSVPLLFLGGILVGVGLGSEGDIAAYVVSRYIPPLSYARVYGFVIFLFAQGSALGVFMLGLSVTTTGSARSAAWVIAVLSVVAAALLLLLGPYRYTTSGRAVEPAPAH
jgi:MFS family permease